MNNGFEWLLLDTETDGLMEPIHVVEIAAQRMRGWTPNGEPFRVLINHNVPIPSAAVAIHGYTEEFLRKNGEDPLEAHELFRAYAGDLPAVAHNLSFDWNRALCPEWQRLGLPPVGRRGFCTLMLSRRVVDETKSYRLDALREVFGISADHAHRAFGDVYTMVTLFDQVFRPRLEGAGIVSFDGVAEFTRRTPVAKCLCAVRSKAATFAPDSSSASSDSWYFIDAQEQTRGPLPAKDILAFVGGNPFWVWREGLGDWVSSEKCPDFLASIQTVSTVPAPAITINRWIPDHVLADLLGVCRDIIADGVVTSEEVLFLSKWLEGAGVMTEWPGTEIAETVERIMADGVVTDGERAELLHLLQRVNVQCIAAARSEPGRGAHERILKPTAAERPSNSEAGVAIKLSCACGQRVMVDSTAAGQEFNCPACGKVMRVPTVAEGFGTGSTSEQKDDQLGRTTAKVELMCVGNAGGGYINAQVRVMWFEVLVDEVRRKVDVIEHDLPIKTHRREKRVNFCEYEVPEGVVCFYSRHVQTKPNVYESKFFRFDSGLFQTLGDGAPCDFFSRFLSEYQGYDVCSDQSQKAVDENRARRLELDELGPGVYVTINGVRDNAIPPWQSVSDMDLANVAPRGPKEEEATEKQRNFLRSLGVQDEDFLAGLGKWQASRMIEHILENRGA